MKLLAKKVAESKLKAENDNLVEDNIRLRKFKADIVQQLNTIKDTYEPDKIARLKEFEDFCHQLQAKKGVLLEEIASLEMAIQTKKEMYYALIARQDELDSRALDIDEAYKKLEMREKFVVDLEQRWRAKNN